MLVCSVVGLKSHPQHEVAKKQTRGNSGMVCFYIKGGEDEARTFLSSLKVMIPSIYLFVLTHDVTDKKCSTSLWSTCNCAGTFVEMPAPHAVNFTSYFYT